MPTIDHDFAARIQARYPEGLTGVFAIGATRRTFILDQNRRTADPGHIQEFSAMGAYLLRRYLEFIGMFFDLGGQNALITALSFRSFFERGAEYPEQAAPELLRIIGDEACTFYRENNIDPYFMGIDSLRLQPAGSPGAMIVQALTDFQARWAYGTGRRKLLWEIASMPLLTFWQAFEAMSEAERNAFDQEIGAAPGLNELYQLLYRRFARIAYGTEIPIPHLYLGTNMSGDLKWRSPMPISLTGGDYVRMFYTPYPPSSQPRRR